MPKHKLSGAQRQKKQKNDEKEALKSKELISKFLYLKKAKTDDAESESESEDDSVLKHTKSESEDDSRYEGSHQLFAEND